MNKAITVKALAFMLSVAGLSGSVAMAKTDTKPQPSNNKGTDLNFDDLLVEGKYHFSGETVVTVEQDKVLDALLGVRKDFRDKIEKSSTRY